MRRSLRPKAAQYCGPPTLGDLPPACLHSPLGASARAGRSGDEAKRRLRVRADASDH